MSYRPDPTGTPKSFEEFMDYVRREFERISVALQGGMGDLREYFSEPEHKTENMMVIADGQRWNPTTEGRGVYIWTGGQWNLIKALPPRAVTTPIPTENTAPENTVPTPPFVAGGPTIVSLLPESGSVDSGSDLQLTVTLNSAPLTDTVVALTTSAPGLVSVPTSVTVLAGQTTASFNATGVSQGVATITAGLNGTSDTSSITVRPVQPDPEDDPDFELPADVALAIPTFHCMSLYWKPPAGSTITNEQVFCEYKKSTDSVWKKAYPLWYCAPDNEVRGSVVYLDAGTSYDFRLGVVDGVWTAGARASTWTENPDGTVGGTDFPIGTVTQLGTKTGVIFQPEGGTPSGYRVYENGTIDGDLSAKNCMEIRKPYIIFRNVVFKRSLRDLILMFTGAHHIVFEKCEFTEWGSKSQAETDDVIDQQRRVDGVTQFGPYHGKKMGFDCGLQDACVRMYDQRNVDAIIFQYCNFHSPRFGSNSWDTGHPLGPVALYCYRTTGKQWVFRYNDFATPGMDVNPDTTNPATFNKYWQDIIIGRNFGVEDGCLPDDSDFYGNYILGCMDDAIETEGRIRNVRVWNNFMDNIAVACASTQVSRGPLYVFRNVSGRSRKWHYKSAWAVGDQSSDEDDRQRFGKCATVTSAEIDRGGGRRFIFHNTILQPPARGIPGETRFPVGLGIGVRGLGSADSGWQPLQNTIARNNIWHLWKSSGTAYYNNDGKNNNVDYDLTNGQVIMPSPNVLGANMLTGTPTYKNGHGWPGAPKLSDVNKQGLFQLASGGGLNDGQQLNNFNTDFEGGTFFGAAPDRGAHEDGARPIQYGRNGRGNGKPIA